MEIPEKKKLLSDEILEYAGKKAARVVKAARREEKDILRKAREEAEREGEALLADARARALRILDRALAGVAVEVRRKVLQAREEVIEAIFREALEHLRQKRLVGYGEVLERLITEALGPMPGEDQLVIVRPEDRARIDRDLLRRVRKRAEGGAVHPAGLDLADENAEISGGVILRSRDGRCTFDNSFETRLERLRGVLRAELHGRLFGEGRPQGIEAEESAESMEEERGGAKGAGGTGSEGRGEEKSGGEG
jgi:V/A-type H+-transporting ATPase subunit E